MNKQLENIIKLLEIDIDVLNEDETSVQRSLAPILRRMVVNHLRTGKSSVAEAFRLLCPAALLIDTDAYLGEQSQNGVWATDKEAIVLGVLFDCNVVVLDKKNGRADKEYPLHEVSDKTALTIRLNNADNQHWYLDEKTLGKGNCLYNAVAQFIHRQYKEELALVAKKKDTISAAPCRLFSKPVVDEIIRHQKSIASSIAKNLTIEDSKEDGEKWQTKLSSFSKSIQDQIKMDHQLALELAHEEMKNVSTKKTI